MVTPSALEELSLVTAVLRRLAGPDIEDSARAILEHHHPRLQTLMIALLSKFSERDRFVQQKDSRSFDCPKPPNPTPSKLDVTGGLGCVPHRGARGD